MTTGPLELFYSYAREDETLRDQLEDHLALLKRQGLIRAETDSRYILDSIGTLSGEAIECGEQKVLEFRSSAQPIVLIGIVNNPIRTISRADKNV